MFQDMRKLSGSKTGLKLRVMDEFKDQAPQSTALLVRYFEGCQHTKYWICTEQDLSGLCNHHHNEILLWCDGHIADEQTTEHSRAQ